MNAEVFAEWFRLQGHRVIRTPSSYWCEIGPRVYQAFPYHWLIDPQDGEPYQLLSENKAIGLRYSTSSGALQGKISYHAVYEDDSYDLSALSTKMRTKVRRGLKYVNVKPIPVERLATEGWTLRSETSVRQGRVGAESPAWWHRLCLSAEDLPGFEAWGAIHEGQLVAALLAFTCDDTCSILYQQSATEYLRYKINNALTYAFTLEALGRSGISQIFYGLHSLDAPSSVDEFKFHMGYTAKPVRQRVVFHPWLTPVFNSASHAVVMQLLRWRPGQPTLAKTEGMIRFYLEGKRPLNEQNWPECLTYRKRELLKHGIVASNPEDT